MPAVCFCPLTRLDASATITGIDDFGNESGTDERFDGHSELISRTQRPTSRPDNLLRCQQVPVAGAHGV